MSAPTPITITIQAMPGTGNPPLWRCRADIPGQVRSLGVEGTFLAVIAALRATLDDWERDPHVR